MYSEMYRLLKVYFTQYCSLLAEVQVVVYLKGARLRSLNYVFSMRTRAYYVDVSELWTACANAADSDVESLALMTCRRQSEHIGTKP
jgi:hypothetical protein